VSVHPSLSYMPAVRKASKRSSRRSAPYSKTRSSTRGKPVRKLASSRVTYDRQVVESPSVGLGQGAHTRLRTFFHSPWTLGATGLFTGFLKPFSCFDPCGDLASLQPNLYDTWKTVYGRYLVISATVKISLASTGAASATLSNSGTLVAYPSIDPTAKTTVQDAASQPYSKTILYQPGNDKNVMYFKIDARKVLGKYGPLESLANGAAVTADPPSGQHVVLPLYFESLYRAATSPGVTAQIEIVQDVWFDKRINVNDIIE